ncbi:MAG TPA: hypothetical protein VIH72_07330 [Candidatus Acidoferrales bacterium]|jgi:hypothetical protein
MNFKRTAPMIVMCMLAITCGISMTRASAGTAIAAPAGNITWVKFTDPLEQAFTLEVPQGWAVKGGMFRLGYSDHREMVDMTSPDGKINIRIGDLSIPPYFLPNQSHREGEIYDLGAQAQGRVARYRTGQEFSAAYGKVRFARVCASVTPKQSSLPPIAKPIEPAGGNNSPTKTSDGEATYSCAGSQGARIAYVFSQTAPAGGLWQVTNLVSYVAPDADVAATRSIIEHAEKTFVLSPAWIQKQKQLDEQALVYQRERQQARMRQLSEQVAQFEAKMQAMQSQVNQFERGQAQRQSQFQAFDNVINGVTPTVDPFGNEHDVSTGAKSSYWRNPATGETVNADKSPGPGWQPLTIKQ